MAKTRFAGKALDSLKSPDRTITVQNRNSLIMEGCERIILCEKEKMILQGKMRVEIEGKNLHLKKLGNENMEVAGRIDVIRFGEAGV